MTDFIGRAEAVERLVETLDAANKPGLRCCVIRGEAGTGKSRLIDHALGILESDESPVVAFAQCSSSTRPFAPFRQAIESLLPEPDEVPNERQTRMIRRLLRGVRELAPDVAGIFVPGSAILVAAARFAATEAHDAGWFQRFRKQEDEGFSSPASSSIDDIDTQAVQLFRSLSSEEPLVLIIEDAHWIDSESIGLIHRMMQDLRDPRLTIVLTYRSSDVDAGSGDNRHSLASLLAEIGRSGTSHWLDLDQLSEEEGPDFCRRLAERFPGAAGLADHLYTVTRGLPLFAIEYLQLMEESGDLCRDAASGEWSFRPRPASRATLTSVRSVVRERLDRLDDELLNVLEHCSIEGSHFDAGRVSRLMDSDLLTTINVLSRTLDRQHHIVTDDVDESAYSPGTRRYQFHNELMREEVYERIPGNYRRELHARFAEILEAEPESADAAILAGKHRSMAGDLTGSVQAYTSAARLMHEKGNAVEALQLVDRAEAAAGGATIRLEVQARLALVHGQVAKTRRFWAVAMESYKRACELGDYLTDEEWTQAQLGMGTALLRTQQNTQARVTFMRLLASPRSVHSDPERLEAARQIGVLQKRVGDLDGALGLYLEVRDAAARAGEHHTLAQVTNNIGFMYSVDLSDPSTGGEWYRRAAEVAAKNGLERDRVLYLRNSGHTLAVLGRGQEAIALVDESVQLADAAGTPNDQFRARLYRAKVWLALGRYQDARQEVSAVLERFEFDLRNDNAIAAETRALAAAVSLLVGEFDDCLEHAKQSIELLPAGIAREDIGTAAFSLATADLLSTGDRDTAHERFVAELQKLNEIHQKCVRQELPTPWRVRLNQALAEVGAAATARNESVSGSYLQEAAERARSCPNVPGGFAIWSDLANLLGPASAVDLELILDLAASRASGSERSPSSSPR